MSYRDMEPPQTEREAELYLLRFIAEEQLGIDVRGLLATLTEQAGGYDLSALDPSDMLDALLDHEDWDY